MEYDLFGETATDRFDNLVLLAGFNLTWTHFVGKQRKHAHYIADSWTKDAFRRMGYISAHNKFCHLYLNGLYWGVYNLSERLDEEFMESYLGGQEEDYDIFKDFEEMKNGNYEAWGEMLDLSHHPQNYLRIQGKNEQGANDPSLPNYLDMDQFIDYMILNFYIGNLDWDMHNWVAARNRKEPGKGFKFFPWDSEHSFLSVNHDVTKDYVEKRASYFFHVLKENPFFQQKFSDRAKSLLEKGGILSPDSVAYHWREKSEEISLALIAESARWGDYRRDVHSYKLGPYNLYTPKSQWNIEQKRLFDTYFPMRSARVLRMLRSQDLVKSEETHVMLHGVYPNPVQAHAKIFYELDSFQATSIELFDSKGKWMKSLLKENKAKGLHELNCNTQSLPNGLYFYRIEAGEHGVWGKLFIGGNR